jgi:ABC-type branched-subunit amino acid transport system ATPase component
MRLLGEPMIDASNMAGRSLEVEAAPAPLFRAIGLHKRFGGVQAVRDISFGVPPGAVLAIIGPNGAGKSTLLNLMSGVHQPDAGRMIFGGADLVGLPAYRRARLGLGRTFQKIRLFRHLTALDNVIAGFHIRHRLPVWQYISHGATFRDDHARCREQATELSAFVGLAQRAEMPGGALAYGEQRMLELARALAPAPHLLLIDEPAAGLNAVEVEHLLDRLMALRARGLTVIVVEHNMDLVMRIADRVLVLNHGQYLFEGTPREVQMAPAVVAAYLGPDR